MTDLQKQLMNLSDTHLAAAREIRETDPESSFRSFQISDVCRKAAEAMERLNPVQMEIEGDARSTWWYVCGECNGAVDRVDCYCRHCGRPFEKEKHNHQ